MARPIEDIKDLHDKRQGTTFRIVVRIVSLWVVQKHQPPKNGHLENILMDAKGDQIQVSVKKDEFVEWYEKLVENQTYIMQNGNIVCNELQYKACDNPYRMFFTSGTTLRQKQLPDFPLFKYRFTPVANILDGKLRKDLLIDVIGAVDERFTTKQKMVEFTMQDLNHDTIICTLWDDWAAQFVDFWNQRRERNQSGIVVVIVRHGRIKEAQGKYPTGLANAWNGTKLFTNQDMEEIQNFKKDFGEMKVADLSSQGMTQMSSCSQFGEAERFMYKAAAKSIADIKRFICTKETNFVTVGTTVEYIAGKYGWFYDACSNCSKKRPDSIPHEPFKCSCDTYNQVSTPRFKLELKVEDKGETARIVFWDAHCKELIGQTAAALRQEMIDDEEEDPKAYPYKLDKMLNKKMALRINQKPSFTYPSVQNFSLKPEIMQAILDQISPNEGTSKLESANPKGKESGNISTETLKDEMEKTEAEESIHFTTQSLSATADYDPDLLGAVTPAKRVSTDESVSQDLASAQLSSTKMTKHIKTE